MDLEFEWDDDKRARNLAKHGIDFLRATLVFDGRQAITEPSAYVDEERYITVAVVDGRYISVIWTPRGTRRRIISARRSRDGEERAYRADERGTD